MHSQCFSTNFIVKSIAYTLTRVLPKTVQEEIEDGPDDDPAKMWLAEKGKTYIQETGEVPWPGLS